MSRRVAAVVQRFGADIIGGERLAWQVLQRLSAHLDITVLTTCARDYISWNNYYPAGETREGKLRVMRFPVSSPRHIRIFSLLSVLVLQRRVKRWQTPLWLEDFWIRLQGPYCPALLRQIAEQRDDFDAFIFYTYLYYPTVRGLPLASGKSILVPEAHDERPLRLAAYRELFTAADALVYLSQEEQALANAMFGLAAKPQRVASVGIEPDSGGFDPAALARSFAERHGIDRPYFLYLGRVDANKGLTRLFSYFERWSREQGRDCLLVLAGSKHMPVPDSEYIRYLGELSDDDRRGALVGAQALLLLSPYESLSLSLLEGFANGRPAIVSADSQVLVGHIDRSGAGFAVSDYPQFAQAANRMQEESQRNILGARGKNYVHRCYGWDLVESAYLELIETVAGNRRRA